MQWLLVTRIRLLLRLAEFRTLISRPNITVRFSVSWKVLTISILRMCIQRLDSANVNYFDYVREAQFAKC